MPRARKFSDDEVISKYQETGSVWETAKLLGVCGQSVHERLVKLGASNPQNVWTEEDDNLLREHYGRHSDNGTVHELAERLGRSDRALFIRAFRLGIVSPRGTRPKLYLRVWKGMAEDEARTIFEDFRRSPLILGEY